jgi:hypothetical protein
MMKFVITGCLAIFLSTTLCNVFAYSVAQQQAPAIKKINPIKQIDVNKIKDKNLRGQYDYFMTKTYDYQQPLLAAFYKNIMDTLNVQQRKIAELRAKVNTQTQAVSSLKADVNSKEQSLTESNAKVDNINVFGMLLPKATYNLVMFGLVGGLALALIIVIVTTAKYKHEARHRIELYDEIDEEYRNYKAKASEKEKKLARELQTERNKVDELMGRS